MGKKYPVALPVRYVREILLTRYKGWVATEDNIEFIPTSKFSFKQGGFLNSIRFILEGKRRAKKFLKSKSS